MAEETRSVAIVRELYDELRAYCDRHGIRFVDFIENALETATFRHELETQLTDKAAIEQQIRIERAEARGEGFHLGVAAATLVFQAQGKIARHVTPPEADDYIICKPVTGGQIPMFD